VIKYLLKSGANPGRGLSFDEKTLLHYLCSLWDYTIPLSKKDRCLEYANLILPYLNNNDVTTSATNGATTLYNLAVTNTYLYQKICKLPCIEHSEMVNYRNNCNKEITVFKKIEDLIVRMKGYGLQFKGDLQQSDFQTLGIPCTSQIQQCINDNYKKHCSDNVIQLLRNYLSPFIVEKTDREPYQRPSFCYGNYVNILYFCEFTTDLVLETMVKKNINLNIGNSKGVTVLHIIAKGTAENMKRLGMLLLMAQIPTKKALLVVPLYQFYVLKN
jgi:hypothetical protein